MIIVPEGFYNGPYTKKFVRLIEVFNSLDKDMMNPRICEGNADRERLLKTTMQELIRDGYI